MSVEGEDKSMVASEHLRQLAAQKEQEWRSVQELRIKSLEGALRESEKTLQEYKAKFNKLKDDFKYNLKLLQQRDSELSSYDSHSVATKRELAVKEAEISDLKIALDEAKRCVSREAKSRDELQEHYQKRMREKQAEIDQYKAAKDAELNKERFDLENMKRELERKVVQLEEEMDAQRRDLTSGFEEEMRKRDHENRKRLDEGNAAVLAHEMKVKLLSKELQLLKSAQSSVVQGYEERDSALQQLQKQLKAKEWEVQDFKAVQEARIRELELKLQQAEHTAKRAQEDYNRKHAELNRYMSEKEAALNSLKTASAERERHLEDTARHVTSQLESKEAELRQLEWQKQDMEREKDAQIEKLEDEVNDVRSRLNARASEVERESTAKDLELDRLQNNESKLKSDLLQRKQDVDRYKKEVEQALEREASLERSKAQLQLDWQRRYEDVERQQYFKSEELIRHLTQARDEAQALLKEKVREVKHQSDVMTVLADDRDRALATLKHYGLETKKDIDMSQFNDLPASAAKQLQELQLQNDNLRQVVHQMRAEMERLGAEARGGEEGPATKNVRENHVKHSVASEYVQNLEKEIKTLKKKCRDLEQKADDALGDPELDDVRVTQAVGDNMLVQSHIERLNAEIGKLRSEKVELTAQTRKQQARIQYLEGHMEELSKEPREKQVQLQQLQYELAAESRRAQAEVSSLNQRIRSLEMQLVETRKEADEYMKANIEANNRVTSLGQQISSLKVDIAQATPTVNFGAQEILIQQLQDEIGHLRNQLKGQGRTIDTTHVPVATKGQEGHVISELHSKLRHAAKQITQLAKEKQQLIEMGNRLRAELNRHKIAPPPGPPKQAFVQSSAPANHKPPSHLQSKIQTKLSQLEQLQYELTKQELSYQQRFGGLADDSRVPAINVDSSSDLDTSGTGAGYQPKSILKKSIEFVDKLSPVPENDVHVTRSKSVQDRFANGHSSARVDKLPQSARSDVTSQRSSSPIKEHPPLRISMSSVGGESLQEIWNLLDQEATTPRTPYDSHEGPFPGLSFPGDTQTNTPPASSRGLTVMGTKNPLKPKPSQEPKKLTPRAAGRRANKPQNKAHVRNWNQKDDTQVK